MIDTEHIVEGMARAMCFADDPDTCGCVGECQLSVHPGGIYTGYAQAALSSALPMIVEECAKAIDERAERRHRTLLGQGFDPDNDWDDGIEAYSDAATAIRAIGRG